MLSPAPSVSLPREAVSHLGAASAGSFNSFPVAEQPFQGLDAGVSSAVPKLGEG